MIGIGLKLSWGVFIISALSLFIPVLFSYIRTKSMTDQQNNRRLEKIAFFANNLLLYLISIIICTIILTPYYHHINSNNINGLYKDIMNTGIVLPFVLWISGIIIRTLYKFILKMFNTMDLLEETSKEAILVVSLLMLIPLLMSTINFEAEEGQKQFMVLVFVLSVTIGKYIWLDTTWENLKEKLSIVYKKNKSSIIIGILMVAIMVFIRILPIYIPLNTAVSIFLGVIVSILMLIAKAIYDYKKTI